MKFSITKKSSNDKTEITVTESRDVVKEVVSIGNLKEELLRIDDQFAVLNARKDTINEYLAGIAKDLKLTA